MTTTGKSDLACRLLAATALAALFAAAPVSLDIRFDAGSVMFGGTAALAKDGEREGGERADRDDRGGDHAGRDDGGSDDSGGDDGGDNSGSSESGGGDDGGGHNRGPGNGDDGADRDDRGDDGSSNQVDRETGARIEIEGDKVEVLFPDGWKEELNGGTYELKDPRGRTVVERPATAADRATLRDLLK